MVKFNEVYNLILKADGEDKDGYKFRFDKYGDKDWISNFEQYRVLQRFAFSLDNRKVNISQELADFLNAKYDDLIFHVEEEKEIDLSGDYIIDFDCWVKGKENTAKCW